MKIKTIIKSFFLLGVFSLSISAFAVWTAPTSLPTGDNVNPPVNVGSATQQKTGGIVVGGFRSTGPSIADTTFDMNGLVTITNGLKITSSAGINKVLTSDATGNATWQDPTGSGANTALSNLAAVAINTSLLTGAGGVDLGSTTKPFRDLFVYGTGTYGTQYFRITGAPTGTRTITLPNATDTLVGKATTDTLTNKTLTAGSNVIDADTAVSLAANGSNCAAGEYARGVDASGNAENCTVAGGGGGAPVDAKYITQTANATLTAEQALSALGTGILKNTTGTGVLSIAGASDFPNLNQNTTGNAGTATALATNGSNCAAGNYPLGVDANGNAEGCTAAGGGGNLWTDGGAWTYLTATADRLNIGGNTDPGASFKLEVSGDSKINGITVGKAGSAVATNTAVGVDALSSNTSGSLNAAFGYHALDANTTASENSAFGYNALATNSSGTLNAAFGTASLLQNTTGGNNSAFGNTSLNLNTTGFSNTAAGRGSLGQNTTGWQNTAVGVESLTTNTTGTNNTAIGFQSNVSANNLSNAMALGYQATVTGSNKVRIGNAAVTEIGGAVAWSNLSDIRFKENIKSSDLGLNFILKLNPVSYELKNGNKKTSYGFIAQDIEKLIGSNNNLVSTDETADHVKSLRYTEFIGPMVKAMQEQQQMIEDLKMKNDSLELKIKQIESKLN